MKQTFLFAGIGGQGVQVLGKLVALCANAQGLRVTLDAKYSGNMRGAPSNCTVIISDHMIGNPVERRCDHLIVFTREAQAKLAERLVPNGVVWRDSTLVERVLQDRPYVTDFACPATALAESLGDVRCANIVMAGFLAETLSLLDTEKMKNALEQTLWKKPHLIHINQQAFDAGVRYAQEHRSE